jgi:hypothetical protein
MTTDLSHREILLLKKVEKSPSQTISKAELIGKDPDNAARVDKLLILRLIAYCDIEKLQNAEGYVVERDECGNVIPSQVYILLKGKDVVDENKRKRKDTRRGRLFNFIYAILGMIFGFLLDKYGNTILTIIFPNQ